MNMYWRFTDRARKVMQLANQEAQRLNHSRLGTEHVLLGLVKEGLGVGARVLTEQKVDLPTLRREVEAIVPQDVCEMTLGKLPQTNEVRRILDLATQEAKRSNCSYVGTEHLLLALLSERDGVAAEALHNSGVRLDRLRTHTLSVLARPTKLSRSLARRAGLFVHKHPGTWAWAWSLAGTLIGGLIGREFGDGDMTLTGAITGTLILGAIGSAVVEEQSAK